MRYDMRGHQYDLLSRGSNDSPRPSECPRSTGSTISSTLRLILFPSRRLLTRLVSLHFLKRSLFSATILLAVILVFTYFLNPSYAHPPPYTVPRAARVFIAANIVDEEYRHGTKDGLVLGPWGDSLIGLTAALQSHNIPFHVSVYGGPSAAMAALDERLSGLHVPRTVVAEESHPIDLATLPRIEIPTGEYQGEKRVKRITYLAAVRNKALEPLGAAEERYTHLLFINDVNFRPSDAVRLLFGTNAPTETSDSSHPNYRAACAVDFITSWKFYDSFASRDADGYGIGVPIFPWFGNKGNAVTRNDLLAGRDTVRVKSCWGGMVAFEARFFQGLLPSSSPTANNLTLEADTHAYRAWAAATLPPFQAQNLPKRFRGEPHPFWDASECCLVHADIAASTVSASTSTPAAVADFDTGIYINPYVRVAYSPSVFAWLPFAQRLERLFSYPQSALNILSSMPKRNVLREKAGTRSYDGDAAVLGDVVVDPGAVTDPGVSDGFCQVRQLLLLREGPLSPGMRNWENVGGVVPPVT